tara:strand:+ start:143 stop:1429 length:1287 start_codon:yes stop_codon:yes gene_type:complete
MNIFKSSFLIIGEGVTFEHCSKFFKENNIIYYSTTTNDVIDITNHEIICRKKKIDLDKVDYAVISPGIPPTDLVLQKLASSGCKFTTDIEIIQNLSKSKFICITGTNGKTSTVNLIADILNDNNISAIACGNNGISVFASLENSYDYILLEISSYQLEYINKLNSFISIVLNLSEDHLERHKTLEKYFEIKEKIFNCAEHKLIHKNLDHLNKYSTFEVRDKMFLINDSVIDGLSIKDCTHISYSLRSYIIDGIHDLHNLCASISVLNIIGLSLENILSSFDKRKKLKHRVEKFFTFNGIKFINDSKSTNADSTSNALKSLGNNIILIMGGDHKRMSYKNLTELINDKVRILVMIGDNKDDLKKILHVNINQVCYEDLEHAISYIFSVMVPGDTVLLSPGTSSYYVYDNYQHRGNHFKELVKKYASQQN